MTTPTDAELIEYLKALAKGNDHRHATVGLNSAADRLAALVAEAEAYEGMKEGVAIRIADLEAEVKRLNGSLTMGALKLAWDANEQLEAERNRLRKLVHEFDEWDMLNGPGCTADADYFKRRIREVLGETS